MMYGASANNITIVEIVGLYDFVTANFPPSKAEDAHQCFITSIQYAGNAASVEMAEESAYGNDYTNYFQLLKIEGQWLIVSKAFNSDNLRVFDNSAELFETIKREKYSDPVYLFMSSGDFDGYDLKSLI